MPALLCCTGLFAGHTGSVSGLFLVLRNADMPRSVCHICGRCPVRSQKGCGSTCRYAVPSCMNLEGRTGRSVPCNILQCGEHIQNSTPTQDPVFAVIFNLTKLGNPKWDTFSCSNPLAGESLRPPLFQCVSAGTVLTWGMLTAPFGNKCLPGFKGATIQRSPGKVYRPNFEEYLLFV